MRYDYGIKQTIWQLRKRVIKPFLVAESSLVKLPDGFDFAFFFGGMKRLLQQEHVMVSDGDESNPKGIETSSDVCI